MSKPKSIQRDIVDMFYDDGLTPEEALAKDKLEREQLVAEEREIMCQEFGPSGPKIKTLHRIAMEANREKSTRVEPGKQDSLEYRRELAHEFRQAIEALAPMPDKTCDWCGADLYRDHKTIDRDFLMCNPCHAREDPAWRQYVVEAYSRPMHEGEMER